MTKDEKIALSEKLAFLYAVDANSEYIQHGFHMQPIGTWLIDDTKRMFEMAVEHGVGIEFSQDEEGEIYAVTTLITILDNEKWFDTYCKYHASTLEATLVAIAKALIKLKE